MPTLVEDKGRVQLFKNEDGTFSAFENGSYTPIKDYGQPPTPTTISNIVAADYYNGFRVVVFNGGHLWYVDANWQKAAVGPNGRDTENLSNSEVNSLFLSVSGSGTTPVQIVPNPITYSIIGPASVDEGTIAMFQLQTTGLPAGTLLTYNITGIDPSRVVAGEAALSGTVSIGASGTVPIPLPLAANFITDGPSTATIRLSNGQASFTAQINDTSKASTSSTLIEGSGGVKLFRNSDGTSSAFENGVYTPIKDFGPTPTTISNIVAADWWNGYRVVVFSGGHTWYVNSDWQKANVGPNGESTTTLNVDGVGAITGSNNVMNLVEGFGQIKLYRNSDGTQSALENGTYFPLKNTSYGGSPNAGVSGFVAVDFYNGVRVAVYESGAFWYMNSTWAKDRTGPNGDDTGNVSYSQVGPLFLSNTVTSYTLSASTSSVNEGSTASFNLTTTGVTTGTVLNYNLSGVSSADIVGGALTGSVSVGGNGSATIQVPINADRVTEGPETLSVAIAGTTASASMMINDTSTLPVPSYQLSQSASTVDEGGQASFRLVTTGVTAGTVLNYNLSGVSSADIVGGSLTGSVSVGSDGSATIQVPISADRLTEGVETLSVAITGTTASASMMINDTSPSSIPTYQLSSNAPLVDEGDIAYFTLQTTNVVAGTLLYYNLSGVTPEDIATKSMSGTVAINSVGRASIAVPIAADRVSENIETLNISLVDDFGVQKASSSVTINDTSKQTIAATYVIAPSASSVNEGSTAKFTVTANGATTGTSVAYTLTGLNPEDIVGGEVNGRISLDDLGMATISVPVAADAKTEGSESLTVTIGNATSTITVNDTSKSSSQYYISASDGIVSEGRIATFTVSAADAVAGTKLAYTISGSGITTKDIGNGKLSGSVSVGSDSSAIITVPIAADKITESDEELTLTLTGKGVSETITIEDTSTEVAVAATYDLSAVESSVKEGEDAEFLIETDPSQAGKSFKWSITGVSTADVAGKKLSGTVVIDEDGTATITVPIASDVLAEGNETLTLTVNGKKASVAVLDDNTVKIASVVLENDTQGVSALYKLGDGSLAIGEAGLYDGDELTDYTPLKASPSKNYVLPKSVVSLITYPEVGYGLLSKTGSVYSEQKFSEEGIAQGKVVKLSASQLLAKETEIGIDLDDDGNIGDAISAVLDEDGDASQQDSGLFQTLTGSLVVASTEMMEGDAISDGLVLMMSKTKAFTLKSTQTVLGLAQKESGNWEVLTQAGKIISAQTFDADTGLIKGKAIVLKTAQVDAREYYYNLDLTGDGDISLVGQETMPVGWAT